jgi:hypothetical protein
VVLDLSPIHYLDGPFAVVCHDAGATNYLLSWLQAAGRVADCMPVMQGPAIDLWNKYFPDGPHLRDLTDALRSARTMVTGTGWASDIEHQARILARSAGIRNIAIVDHWTNYRARFERDGVIILPDEVWVADEEAVAIAQRTLPEVVIVSLPNCYLSSMAVKIPPVPEESPNFLYVLEPIREKWSQKRAGEFEALDYTLSKLDCFPQLKTAPIRLRPHPSDPPGKYDSWISSHSSIDVALDDQPDLGAAIGRAKWVAGCQSFALVVALEAGRIAICTLPPWAPPCILPHKSLIHLRNFAG